MNFEDLNVGPAQNPSRTLKIALFSGKYSKLSANGPVVAEIQLFKVGVRGVEGCFVACKCFFGLQNKRDSVLLH